MKSIVRPSRCCRSRRRLIDLRLDRHVEGRDRLVGDDELGLEREGAGDADALALAAGELMGVAVDGVGRQVDVLKRLRAPCRGGSSRVPMPWIFRPSVRISPMVIRGDRLAKGSWKMYCMRRRWRPHLGRRQLGDLGAVEGDGAGGGLDQPQDGATDGGLAAAGFADEADDLALAISKEMFSRMRNGGAARRARTSPGRGRRQRGAEGFGRGHGWTSCQRMQRLWCRALTSSSAGTAARQASMAQGQRGAKAQPGGRRAGSGPRRGWRRASARRLHAGGVAEPGHRYQQPDGVGVARVAEDFR